MSWFDYQMFFYSHCYLWQNGQTAAETMVWVFIAFLPVWLVSEIVIH